MTDCLSKIAWAVASTDDDASLSLSVGRFVAVEGVKRVGMNGVEVSSAECGCFFIWEDDGEVILVFCWPRVNGLWTNDSVVGGFVVVALVDGVGRWMCSECKLTAIGVVHGGDGVDDDDVDHGL